MKNKTINNCYKQYTCESLLLKILSVSITFRAFHLCLFQLGAALGDHRHKKNQKDKYLVTLKI